MDGEGEADEADRAGEAPERMVDGLGCFDIDYNVLIDATKVQKIGEIAKEKRKIFGISSYKFIKGDLERSKACIVQNNSVILQCFSEREELK